MSAAASDVFSVKQGQTRLVPPLMMDVAFDYRMPGNMECSVVVRVPSLILTQCQITFPKPITFTATQESERKQLQASQSSLRATASKLSTLGAKWMQKNIDQTAAASQIALLNSSLSNLIPNAAQFKDIDEAVQDSVYNALMDETYRKQMIADIEALDKQAEALNNECTAAQPANTAATTAAKPTTEQEKNQQALKEIASKTLSFFLEFNDPNGNKRKQTRMYDWKHPTLGDIGKCSYPLSNHPVTDLVDLFEHIVSLEQALGTIAGHLAQNAELNNMNSTLAPIRAKMVAAKAAAAAAAPVKK